MSLVMRTITLLPLMALLVGCAGQWNGVRSYPSVHEALSVDLNMRVSILYVEPYDANRDLVLFRADDHGPSATLLERVGRSRWRMTEGVGLGGPPDRLGALSYKRVGLGRVKEKVGTETRMRPETYVVFGQILDPAITWVELTLDAEGAKPTQANIQNGFWVAHIPPENKLTRFELRAGDGNGLRFAASVGRGREGRLSDDEALVEYRDEQQGIRLQHPVTAYPPEVKEGRLTIHIGSSRSVSVEQKPELDGQGVEALLQAAVSEANDRVLEHGLRPLGEHEAAYLLEAAPGVDGYGYTYNARYWTVAGGSGYEVTCSVTRAHERSTWVHQMKPVCEKILETVRLGQAAEPE